MLPLGPRLPAELYRNVASALDTCKSDARNALLSLALVSKSMCYESQRVLFARNDAIIYFARDDEDTVSRHHQFVQTIFKHPARFGAFVREFVQVDSAYKRDVFRTYTFSRQARKRERLWELTIRTLPFLINLKVLVMTRQFTPGPTALQLCRFQLEVLQYQPSKQHDNLLAVVLPTQSSLLHLSLPLYLHQEAGLLLDSKCAASLISIDCDMELFGRVARTRKIVAFSACGMGLVPMDDGDVRLCRDALMRLTCFKMAADTGIEWLAQLSDVILSGKQMQIKLLELDNCVFDNDVIPEATFKIYPLPELRVLSLRFSREVWPDQSARVCGAEMAFQLYPKLQQVVFWDETHQHEVKWVYSRPEGGQITTDETENNADVHAVVDDDKSEGSSDDFDSVYANPSTTSESRKKNIAERSVHYREKEVPAESLWGVMWWTPFEI